MNRSLERGSVGTSPSRMRNSTATIGARFPSRSLASKERNGLKNWICFALYVLSRGERSTHGVRERWVACGSLQQIIRDNG